jgi:hypothetical protein
LSYYNTGTPIKVKKEEKLKEHFAHPMAKMQECPEFVTVVKADHLVSISREEWLLAEKKKNEKK